MDFNLQPGIGQQAINHLWIANIVGKFLVRAAHAEALGEFGRLELDFSAKANSRSEFRAELFRPDGQERKCFLENEQEHCANMFLRVIAAVADHVTEIENEKRLAVVGAAQKVERIMVFSKMREPMQKIPFPRELVVAIRTEAFKAQPRGQVAKSELARMLRARLLPQATCATIEDGDGAVDDTNDEMRYDEHEWYRVLHGAFLNQTRASGQYNFGPVLEANRALENGLRVVISRPCNWRSII